MEYPIFCNGSYESQSVTADQERTVNWYFEPMESPGASTRSALYPTPGVEEISEAAVSPGRAHVFINGREFAVIGTSLIEINLGGIQTVRGTVAAGATPATISSNGDGGGQLFITSGGNGYSYDLLTNTLSTVAALNGIADQGDFLDSYFIALDTTTSTTYNSALLDGTSWTTGTDFAQRSDAADLWRAFKVVGQFIYFFGQQTSVAYYNTASSGFPFAPHPSGRMPYGIAASFSAAVAQGAAYWLSATKEGERSVVRAAGFTPEPISDYALEHALSDYTTVDDAIADVFRFKGHTFYRLDFPTESKTWMYDVDTGKWGEWATWISADNDFVAWRPRFHAMAFGEHRMLDAETGSVYRFDTSAGALDVDGRPIRRLRRAPALSSQNRRIFYPGFELALEPGLGQATGQGSDPHVMLRFSNDGGKTWGTEQMRSAGKIGEYGKRVRWNRCGSARNRVFEVSVTDPIQWRITGAYLTPDPYPLQRAR